MSGPTIDPAAYRPRDLIPIRRALVSVSDKSGLVELAAALAGAGVEIVSTGSTAKAIADAGYPVIQVGELTGYPESLDGRVRTLHPLIHSGLLADLRLESHENELAAQGIAPFELLVSNLYPFAETVASGAEPDAVVEQIDIGGPAMVRAAAKNHANVAVETSPAGYAEIIEALAAGGTTLLHRRELALQAFRHTARYDIAVASWLGAVLAPDDQGSGFPGWLGASWDRGDVLRYGENSHQRAAIYRTPGAAGIAQATQLGGKEMSYNNYVDADAAVRAAYDHPTPTVAVIKHANPCGIATADSIAAAHAAAHACDPVSAYGGVIALNRPVTKEAAESIAPIFTEVVIAPGFEPKALEILRAKKNLRLLELPVDYARGDFELRQISGGTLAQEADTRFEPALQWKLVAGEPADAATLADLSFAWIACRAAKSNAIMLAKNGASVGVGMGQVNRVDSCKLAVERAGDRAAGSVAASDAFFPFDDGARILMRAGITAIVQPGGSIRDEDVIAAAQELGVTMYFTGERHFFH